MDLLTFVRYFANSPVRRDVIAYFAHRLEAVTTARDVALRTGHRLQAVQDEMDDLVLLGLLEVEGKGEERRYRLAEDACLRRMVQRLGNCYRDEEC
ncbi:MAG TPA: hypothetical protein G4O02_01490 [Caldilineae bacterium]|nr:hypothetical protein [Caldilineae bacterium]